MTARLFRMAADIATIVAEEVWQTKAEVCVRAISTDKAVLRTASMRAGLDAIRRGDSAAMERWLRRRKAKETKALLEARGKLDAKEPA